MPSQYGYDHKKQRAKLLPKAYGRACPMCGHIMHKTQALDLDHAVPLILGGTVGDRIVHASCNRAAGARLGNTLRKARGRAASQDW